jgi:hypothetical protein
MRYIVRTDTPFLGHVQSHLLDNGTVADTDGLTPDQYAGLRGFPVRTVDDAELDVMTENYINSLITGPVEETAADYDRALNVLPPAKWRVVRGVEMFHVAERITHGLVTWHLKIGDRFFTLNERDNIDMEGLAAKAAALLAS